MANSTTGPEARDPGLFPRQDDMGVPVYKIMRFAHPLFCIGPQDMDPWDMG